MKQQFAAKHPWTILAAGAAIQVLTGIPAAWGVFQQPVMDEYGLSEQGAGYAFGILIAAFGVGCVLGGFLQDSRGPRCAALWGTALLCGGFLQRPCCRAAVRAAFSGIQYPGGAGHGVSVPIHPVLRTEVVCRAQGPCHRRDRRGGGPFRCVSHRVRAHGGQRLWNRAGHPGCVLGTGSRHAARLPCGQPAFAGPAAGCRKQQQNDKNTIDLSPWQMLKTKQYWLCAGAVCFPPRRCFCSAPSS